MQNRARARWIGRRLRRAAALGMAVSWLCLGGYDGALGAAASPTNPKAKSLFGEADGAAGFRTWLPRALAGDPAAAYKIGRAYSEGQRHRADFAEAAHWFRKAARAGHAPAQADLAMLYGKGLGVPRDYVKAYAWFAVAAENGDYGLSGDQAGELRHMMAAFLTPDQRREAERLAAELRNPSDP